ncbi:helix-turn-helix domain-containing protein (plasmid) [Streptomyces sp. NBC_01259]|uniref:helix-turn-helix domain-containing protein n=1 Tax=Streptomyces sp. NBC_01259 TaxID=2903800 RepID=UPI002F90CCEE
MPASKAKQADTAQRRTEMLRMKLSGKSVTQIAEHFGMSLSTASKDISRIIKKARELEIQEAELYREVQRGRLETLLLGVWPDAITGEPKASEAARKLISDLSDLLGVKVPVRTEISGPDGGDIPFSSGELSELKALIEISDQPGAIVPVFEQDTDDEDDELEDAGEGDDDDSDG